MESVKLYSPYGYSEGGAGMEEDSAGDYVTYEDYDALYDKWFDLNAKYQDLYNSIVDVYRNM